MFVLVRDCQRLDCNLYLTENTDLHHYKDGMVAVCFGENGNVSVSEVKVLCDVTSSSSDVSNACRASIFKH